MQKKQKVIEIIIATHKKYWMPKQNIYIPVHVGAEGKASLGYTRDDDGENISGKNPSFCELTGLYWAWNNSSSDYIGLAHYRRHFSVKSKPFVLLHKKEKCVLSEKECRDLLQKYRVILPKKNRYYIETLYSHYAHTHCKEHLDITESVILEKYPEYKQSFRKVMNSTSGYMYNMYIMESELSKQYCEWLFSILFEVEKRIQMPELSQFQGRFCGRISEIIFNVWLENQLSTGKIKKEELIEVPCIHMEKINWVKKGTAFLQAKFFGKKYEESF